MAIWKYQVTVQDLNRFNDITIHKPLGIVFTAIGDDWIEATMPVENRTRQPAGLLHGGASVVLAESLASVASYLCIDAKISDVVGLELSASHLKSVREGVVTGRVQPLRLGKRFQVWDIQIRNEKQERLCVVRLTAAVIEKQASSPSQFGGFGR